MTEFVVHFLEDRSSEAVQAETRAQAFSKAKRKYDATPTDIQEVPDDNDQE